MLKKIYAPKRTAENHDRQGFLRILQLILQGISIPYLPKCFTVKDFVNSVFIKIKY